jgi:radical SAM superfamily enzyme YgiQ (UPF0313 family)
MPRVLLIQPPSTLQRLQRWKSRLPEMEPPLPFVCIGPYLLDAGFEVDVLDLRIEGITALRRILRDSPPLIAGISVMPGSMLLDAIRITRLVKEAAPASKVIWGGTFPGLHPTICLQVADLDFVACGDGEETLAELASVLRDARGPADLSRVAGLAYRREDGTIHTTAPRTPVDLDRKPIGAWHLLDRYMPFYLGPSRLIAINTARGCPYRCTFCYNTALYKGFNRYRVKGLDAVDEEVAFLMRRYHARALIVMDDDFLANRRRGMDMLDRLNRSFPTLRYRIDARADEIREEKTTGQMSRQGLESVFFGVEGVSGEFLERIRKGHEAEDTTEAAKVCAANGIQGTYSFTCGYPDETPRDLYDRVEMARLLGELNPAGRSQIEIISPVMGTPLYDEMRRRDLVPEGDIGLWCRFSDWKSAEAKGWIADARFYESFQLAFYLAFSSRRSDGGMRLATRILSRWSRYRLCGKRPARLPEFRLGNRALKTLIWGHSGTATIRRAVAHSAAAAG